MVSILKWMKYIGYNNFTDLCVDLPFELTQLHDFSNYIVDGQYCTLKFGTMNKHKLFINWMSTRMKYTTFELSPEHLSPLTYEDFHGFRQEDMIRMRSEPASPPPGPTTPTPLTSQTSGSEKRQAFLSQHNDLLDEHVFESTKTLLDQDEFGSFPSSPF